MELRKEIRGERGSALTLDQFLPPATVKPRHDTGIYVKDRCSNPKCNKQIPVTEPKYTLRIKGKEAVYCQACAKAILHPQETTESI